MIELKITATVEQIAGAVFGNLVATANSIYTTHVVAQIAAGLTTEVAHSFAVGKVNEERIADAIKKVPLDIRRRAMIIGYDSVIKKLPVDSPFREPLAQQRDRDLEAMKE
jgi:hypothetical protein